MTINPLIATNQLIALFAVLTALGIWLAWRTSGSCTPGARAIVVGCRAALILGLAVLALNPGSWADQRLTRDHFWTILLDRSLSMATEDVNGQSRWAEALKLANAAKSASKNPDKISIASFDADLSDGPPESPDGEHSSLPNSAESFIVRTQGQAERLSGVLVLSDGRQTTPDSPRQRQANRRIALRARAQESPIFAIQLGGDVAPKDLSVEATRRQFIAFAGQQCTLTAQISAKGLGQIRHEVILETADGVEAARQAIELSPEQPTTDVRFTIDAPAPGTHLFRFRIPTWEGERIAANNETDCTLSVLDGKMRIFMAEGAPYWDSKFLAQMIRQQNNMLVSSVYRLSSDRYFRVETGDERPSDATENTFPQGRDEVNDYDLIVFGKGAEYFLNSERIGLVEEFVRERGGTVLFTRGKPYAGEFEELAFLEPVRWGEKVSTPFRIQPTQAGVQAGLFGGLLPGPADPIWGRLPALQEAHTALSLKPFTQVLLEGQHEIAGRNQKLPILVSRRYGKGLVVMLNADGMWKWDFFPSEDGLEQQYETFWSQLIQWAVTYSEFLPGQDWSLRLNESIVYPDSPVRAILTNREGANAESDPLIEVTREGEIIETLTAIRPDTASSSWEASLGLDEPGSYRLQTIDPKDPEAPGPSVALTVLSPPSERDELSADGDFLAEFTEASGGRVIKAAELSEIVALLDGKGASVDLDRAEWDPAWDVWWAPLLLLAFPAVEWFTRRRSGLL